VADLYQIASGSPAPDLPSASDRLQPRLLRAPLDVISEDRRVVVCRAAVCKADRGRSGPPARRRFVVYLRSGSRRCLTASCGHGKFRASPSPSRSDRAQPVDAGLLSSRLFQRDVSFQGRQSSRVGVRTQRRRTFAPEAMASGSGHTHRSSHRYQKKSANVFAIFRTVRPRRRDLIFWRGIRSAQMQVSV